MLRVVSVSYSQDAHVTEINVCINDDPMQEEPNQISSDIALKIIRAVALAGDVGVEVTGFSKINKL